MGGVRNLLIAAIAGYATSKLLEGNPDVLKDEKGEALHKSATPGMIGVAVGAGMLWALHTGRLELYGPTASDDVDLSLPPSDLTKGLEKYF
jgi:UDP-N-acetylmuramyl pentapeptide phosphotransferase/UDP-N-acetylglucosamine-1-phosphate transferase